MALFTPRRRMGRVTFRTSLSNVAALKGCLPGLGSGPGSPLTAREPLPLPDAESHVCEQDGCCSAMTRPNSSFAKKSVPHFPSSIAIMERHRAKPLRVQSRTGGTPKPRVPPRDAEVGRRPKFSTEARYMCGRQVDARPEPHAPARRDVPLPLAAIPRRRSCGFGSAPRARQRFHRVGPRRGPSAAPPRISGDLVRAPEPLSQPRDGLAVDVGPPPPRPGAAPAAPGAPPARHAPWGGGGRRLVSCAPGGVVGWSGPPGPSYESRKRTSSGGGSGRRRKTLRRQICAGEAGSRDGTPRAGPCRGGPRCRRGRAAPVPAAVCSPASTGPGGRAPGRRGSCRARRW
ncbi:hypothetical protein IF1G_03173 [Cordyceps javanica]|uniref:Uncharacterized protein n=1 Tax=Cordyceps javanica TaxID=43265 RepID=A0A545V6T5_9HYPO|nr:hypothetical protein IF1G_03173 [Cordyceps javanica]